MSRASIALGVCAGLVASALLAAPAVEAVTGLWAARQIRSDLQAWIAAPPARISAFVAPGLALEAPDRATALRALATRIRGNAAAVGVLVETIAPGAMQPGLATVQVRLSGPEKAVIALVDGIERGRPMIRFRYWRATALAEGGVRIEGELVAAWQ